MECGSLRSLQTALQHRIKKGIVIKQSDIMYSTNGQEHKEGNLHTLFSHLFVSLRHGPDLGGYKTFRQLNQNHGVQSKADHFISTSKLSIPRGIDINHQTRASKRNRIAEHARKDVNAYAESPPKRFFSCPR